MLICVYILCLVASYYAFHEGGVCRSSGNHVFGDLLSMLLLEKTELLRNQLCGDAFHALNISHNIMNELKRYVYHLIDLSKTHTTIF